MEQLIILMILCMLFIWITVCTIFIYIAIKFIQHIMDNIKQYTDEHPNNKDNNIICS